ncbi:arginine--tRNA ligase [Blattabacterium cuenoti]|uniref:arginine--tRNA ligase n=1 Tax=Blattabacterium cuenoti TaxID=1653831 RepID=UPI00163C2663|nr:arginine--tRNA ligase [Blattabacterium cuenoti]
MDNHQFQSVEEVTIKAIFLLYKIDNIQLNFQYPKKNHTWDISLILFPIYNRIGNSISIKDIGENIGKYVKKKFNGLIKFSVIKGFLNFFFHNDYYLFILRKISNLDFIYKFNFCQKKNILIEYSSPNANKPLHLGHLRNMLIGSSISNILKMIGHNVIQVQIINDRGIHICKSMIAWKKFGDRESPKKIKMKGDHFVGKYYNLFEKIYNEEIKKFRKNEVPILKKARELLIKWENGDSTTRDIWRKMNKWVYEGFKKTYEKIGIKFDHTEYESDIYNFGKKIIIKGLKRGIFFKKEDGSIWIDLTKEGYNFKLLLRDDKTSVYLTQDIGTAIKRFKEFKIDKMIYIVGKEQENHFNILFSILNRLGFSWVKKLFHLSYEMVFLPSGKMQSRIGNVVNIDDLLSKIIHTAKNKFSQKYLIFNKKKGEKICYKQVGLSALKYYFLQIDPKKKIIFNPIKSIDFKGKTGVYIQYTYSRIRSLEKNFFKSCFFINYRWNNIILDDCEKNVINTIQKYPIIMVKSADNLNPSLLANYIYELSKKFNHLYQEKKLIDPLNIIYSNIYMNIIHIIGNILKIGMNLLGINMVDHM